MNEDAANMQPLQWQLKREAFYNKLANNFNVAELNDLCHSLRLNHEEISGDKPSVKALNLLEYCARNGRILDLIRACQDKKPHITWWSFLERLDEQPDSRVFSTPLPKRGQLLSVALISAIIGGVLFFWLNNFLVQPAEVSSCTDYGIKITSPQPGANLVGREFEVSGSYTTEPPEESLVLIYVSPDGRNFWPQFIVETDPARKTWKGDFLIEGNETAVADIMVATMGTSGRALFDYFRKVGGETGQWPAIERLTDDIVECDRITVVRTNSDPATRTLAISTFDHNDDGWQVVNNEGSGPDYSSSDGNPGGYISAEDAKSGSPWYWSAPAKFLGDKSDAYGGKLTFDLRQSRIDNQDQTTVDIILVGEDMTLELDTADNPEKDWTSYTIPLDESAGWVINGNNMPATSVDLKTVLQSLVELRILGDYQIGAGNCDLDNVVLLNRP